MGCFGLEDTDCVGYGSVIDTEESFYWPGDDDDPGLGEEEDW